MGLFFALAAFLCLVAFAFPQTVNAIARTVNSVLRKASRRPSVTFALLGFLGFTAGALQFAVRGFPLARIHDEFSYLLAADTFSQGRLANPPHPLWVFFESFRINQQPTYSSMYPPGQGLMLALGNVVFGHPWFGVWISVTIFCAISWWALRGWFPAGWALAGALIASTATSWSYWLTSYWGGAVAAIGGALIIGAWPRLARRPAVRESLLFGLGAAILLNSRPYEGFVLVLVALIALVRSAVVKPVAALPVYLRRALFPASLIMLAAVAWTLFYSWRLTGDPLLPPYVLNMRTYSYHKPFYWQADSPEPVYHHELMRRFHALRRDRSDLHGTWVMIQDNLDHFGGSLLLVPLLAFPWIVRRRKTLSLLVSTAAVGAALALAVWIRPHYAAPVAIGIAALTVQSLRCVAAIRLRNIRVGQFAAQAILLLWLGAKWTGGLSGLALPAREYWANARATVQSSLEDTGEQHLVVVRYNESHNGDNEWVYNGADLVNAPVLWVREMAPDQNRALFDFFKDRKIWLMEADTGVLAPYPRP